MNLRLVHQYSDAVAAYVEAFEKAHDIRLDFWVGDDPGGTAMFGDRYFNFDDIRLAVNVGVSSEMLFEWYDQNLEHGREKFIALPSWIIGLRHDQLTQTPVQ